MELKVNIWASTRENLSLGTTQVQTSPHPRSLISVFVILLLESFICKLATGEIFEIVSVAEETGLNLALTETLKTGFLASRPIYQTV